MEKMTKNIDAEKQFEASLDLSDSIANSVFEVICDEDDNIDEANINPTLLALAWVCARTMMQFDSLQDCEAAENQFFVRLRICIDGAKRQRLAYEESRQNN